MRLTYLSVVFFNWIIKYYSQFFSRIIFHLQKSSVCKTLQRILHRFNGTVTILEKITCMKHNQWLRIQFQITPSFADCAIAYFYFNLIKENDLERILSSPFRLVFYPLVRYIIWSLNWELRMFFGQAHDKLRKK